MKKLVISLIIFWCSLVMLIACESKPMEELSLNHEEIQSSNLFDMSVETLALDLLQDCFPDFSASTLSDVFELMEVNKNMLLLTSETLEYSENLADFIWLIERTAEMENKDVQFSFSNGMIMQGVFSLFDSSEAIGDEEVFDMQPALPNTTLSLEEQAMNFLITNIPYNLSDYVEVEVLFDYDSVPEMNIIYDYPSQYVSDLDVKNAVGILNVLQQEIDSNICLILTFTDCYYIVNENEWVSLPNNQSTQLSSREIASLIVLDTVPSHIVPYVDAIDFYPGHGMDSVYVYLSISNYDISYDTFVQLQEVLPELQLSFGSVNLCYVFDSGMEENTYDVNLDIWH